MIADGAFVSMATATCFIIIMTRISHVQPILAFSKLMGICEHTG